MVKNPEGRVMTVTTTDLTITYLKTDHLPRLGSLVIAQARGDVEALAVVVDVRREGDRLTRELAGGEIDPLYLQDAEGRIDIVCKAKVVGHRVGKIYSSRFPPFPAGMLQPVNACTAIETLSFLYRHGVGWDHSWMDRLIEEPDEVIIGAVEWMADQLQLTQAKEFLVDAGRSIASRFGRDLPRAYRLLKGVGEIALEKQQVMEGATL